jgi:hypothetical protein
LPRRGESRRRVVSRDLPSGGLYDRTVIRPPNRVNSRTTCGLQIRTVAYQLPSTVVDRCSGAAIGYLRFEELPGSVDREQDQKCGAAGVALRH